MQKTTTKNQKDKQRKPQHKWGKEMLSEQHDPMHDLHRLDLYQLAGAESKCMALDYEIQDHLKDYQLIDINNTGDHKRKTVKNHP